MKLSRRRKVQLRSRCRHRKGFYCWLYSVWPLSDTALRARDAK